MAPTTAAFSIAYFPDIIYYVFSHLDPVRHPQPQDAYIARQALARLARTCRSFTRPALQTLWKHLPDDQPLADLLCTLGIARRHGAPDNGMDSGKTKHARFELPIQLHPGLWFSTSERIAAEQRWKSLRGYNDRYNLSGSDDPSAHPRWKRLEEYASYVRAVVLFAFEGPKWCDLWQELVSRLGGRTVLPYLRSVSLKAISSHVLTTGAFLLMSPSVDTLDLSFDYDSQRIHPALLRAFDRAPSIHTLCLSVQPWENMHVHGHRVRNVSVVPQVDVRQLHYLAKFADLRSLRISLSDTFALTDKIAFPLLDTLETKGDWLRLVDLLKSTRVPNLRELSLEAWEHGAPAQQVAQYITECMRAISANYRNLTGLTVLVSYGGAPLLGGCVAQSIPIVRDAFEGALLDIIRPLLALHNLRTLSLILPDYLDVDCSSADLLAMSEAWRDLEVLHVELWEYFAPMNMSPPGGDRPRGGPLAAVAHFARNCPRLQTLHLPPVDATALGAGDLEELLPSHRPAHGLQRFITSKVKIGARGDSDQEVPPDSVVKFVESVFPAAAWAFRKERVAVADGWVIVHENAPCLDCRNLRMPVGAF